MAVVAAVEEILAKGFQAHAHLVELIGGCFFGFVRLNESSLQGLILFTNIRNEISELRDVGRIFLAFARHDHGQQPEGGGEGTWMEGEEHDREILNFKF